MFAGINSMKKKYRILFLVAFRRVRVFINIKRISNELVKIHTEVNFFDCVILWDYLLYFRLGGADSVSHHHCLYDRRFLLRLQKSLVPKFMLLS